MAGVIPNGVEWLGSAELHPYLVVDVFTSQPLEGNQLGVFLDGRPFDAEQMQRLARELKFAETVFLLAPSEGGDVSIRIFTPLTELPFAGHPVLGTAFVVGAGARRRVGDAGDRRRRGAGRAGARGWPGRVRPDEAADPDLGGVRQGSRAARRAGSAGVGAPGRASTGTDRPTSTSCSTASEAVAALVPDMAALAELEVGANCFAGRGRSWKTRMFYPAAGVPEDAATGSAAGPLAVHLARHRQIGFGERIEIRQGAEIARPSVLYATVTGGVERIDSVEVGGAALIVAQGRYRIR